jgi:hypothetical protein
MATASSVVGVGDDSSDENVESDEYGVTDLMGLDLPSRQWIAEPYSNARSVNKFHEPRDTNILYFTT